MRLYERTEPLEVRAPSLDTPDLSFCAGEPETDHSWDDAPDPTLDDGVNTGAPPSFLGPACAFIPPLLACSKSF